MFSVRRGRDPERSIQFIETRLEVRRACRHRAETDGYHDGQSNRREQSESGEQVLLDYPDESVNVTGWQQSDDLEL